LHHTSTHLSLSLSLSLVHLGSIVDLVHTRASRVKQVSARENIASREMIAITSMIQLCSNF